jgi:hypothetical protein
MSNLCRLIWYALVDWFRSLAALEAENLALRHRPNILRRRSPKKLTLGNIDRLVFAGLYRWERGILRALTIIKPQTLIRRHRAVAVEIETPRRPAKDSAGGLPRVRWSRFLSFIHPT